MKVEVYLHANDEVFTIAFYSKEFGAIEYFNDGSSIRSKNIREMIMDSYMGTDCKPIKNYNEFKKWGKLIYLGVL